MSRAHVRRRVAAGLAAALLVAGCGPTDTSDTSDTAPPDAEDPMAGTDADHTGADHTDADHEGADREDAPDDEVPPAPEVAHDPAPAPDQLELAEPRVHNDAEVEVSVEAVQVLAADAAGEAALEGATLPAGARSLVVVHLTAIATGTSQLTWAPGGADALVEVDGEAGAWVAARVTAAVPAALASVPDGATAGVTLAPGDRIEVSSTHALALDPADVRSASEVEVTPAPPRDGAGRIVAPIPPLALRLDG